MADEESPPLPILIAPEIPSTSVKFTDTEAEVTKVDLAVANMQLDILGQCWRNVYSISGVCKLVDATIKATKHRRDVLKMEYGPTNKSPRDLTAFPIS